MITHNIFLKSWLQDLDWLAYSLKFIEKNWAERGCQVVVLLDEDCRDKIYFSEFHLNLDIHYETPWPDGYCHAMYQKTKADMYCKGQYILLTDSDCILSERAKLKDFMEDGKPLITFETYSEHNARHPESPWQKTTKRLFTVRTPLHFMGRCATLYHRSTFGAMRNYLESLHQRPYPEIVYSGQPFKPENFPQHPMTIMDYDALGFYAYVNEPDRYVFKHRDVTGPGKFHQYHSWTQKPDPGELDRALQSSAA
jgi:hypothetical protein